jgi:hypothetical protein
MTRNRIFYAICFLLIAYTAIQATRLVTLSPEAMVPTTSTSAPAPEAPVTCLLIAKADNPGQWADLRSIWGTLDYDGGKIIATAHRDEVIGYAATEDGDIWNLPQCTSPD